MNYSLGLISNPEQVLADLPDTRPCCVTFEFDHHQRYKKTPTDIRLRVLCLLTLDDIQLTIVPACILALTDVNPETAFAETLIHWNAKSVSLNEPWLLQTLSIAKPWGAEIWYTGIEDRGVCSSNDIPLPWLFDLFPGATLGTYSTKEENTDPILLKILDPLPQPDYGDLYFELHQEKIEVYVVTNIDPSAWPNGIGQMRYGFNKEKVDSYKTVAEFKNAYLKAVDSYHQTRTKIDQMYDEKKTTLGLVLSDPVDAALLQTWSSELPAELHDREARLKEAMYSFTELLPVKIGDVIQVKPYVPHSLQHGVRVIEFQTAHYERHILSFTQKVLTQNHWDTSAALESAIIETDSVSQHQPALELLLETDGCKVEIVANFPQFIAYRISMDRHSTYNHTTKSYSLVTGVSGIVDVNTQDLNPEQGLFIPATDKVTFITQSKAAVILLAIPR